MAHPDAHLIQTQLSATLHALLGQGLSRGGLEMVPRLGRALLLGLRHRVPTPRNNPHPVCSYHFQLNTVTQYHSYWFETSAHSILLGLLEIGSAPGWVHGLNTAE